MVDAYVIGDGLPELAAALEFAEVGLRVRIGVPAGQHSAVPSEPVLDPGGAMRGFLGHVAEPLKAGGQIAEDAVPKAVPPAPVLLRNAKGGWTVQPTPAVLGVPAVPLSDASIAILGRRGATRAYLDRIKPLLTIGKTHEFGAVVRARLGATALTRLVDPFVRERFGVSAGEVDAAIAAPGLNEAMSRVGSLTAGVLAYEDRNVARETRVVPDGGWEAVRAALRARLELYEATFEEVAVVDVDRTSDDDAPYEVVLAEGVPVLARSVILGFARDAYPGHGAWGLANISGGLTELRPTRWRAMGEVSSEEPGLRADGPADSAVQVVTVDGVEWSVRIDARPSAGVAGVAAAAAATTATVRLSGPAFEVFPGETPPGAAVQRAQADAALAAAGVTVRENIDLSLQVAPYATTTERNDAREHHERQREIEPRLLAVGAMLYGGDEADAVEDARLAAVRLRRQLVGIAD